MTTPKVSTIGTRISKWGEKANSYQPLEKQKPEPPQLCYKNCLALGKQIGLSSSECEFLLALVLFEQESAFSDLLGFSDIKLRRDFIHAIATMLDAPMERIHEMTSGEGKLVSCALATWNGIGRINTAFKLSNPNLSEKLFQDNCNVENILSTIATPPPAPTLGYKDYPHISDTLADLRLSTLNRPSPLNPHPQYHPGG